jgi:DNA mismatch endonuclease (patch repair protein)
MADVLTVAQRQFNMSRIRSQNSKPELMVRRHLHARGLRYRLHVRSIPATPDLVFTRFRAVVFVHGCFWHGHSCPRFKLPATRTEFWAKKIDINRSRDSSSHDTLLKLGWRVLTIWECALRGPGRLQPDLLFDAAEEFLKGSQSEMDLSGNFLDRSLL